METQTDSAPQEPSGQNAGAHEARGSSGGEKNTTMAVIAYILFFVPLLTEAKNDPFVRYHVKQGLVLFLAWVAVSIVSWVPPILFVSPLLHLAMFVLMVVGILHAVGGKEEPLPLIGQFAQGIQL